MGYVIRSATMLTLQEVSDALVQVNPPDPSKKELLVDHVRNRIMKKSTCLFYMECVRENPFEYLILNSSEVDQLGQISREYHVPVEDLCKVLARRDHRDSDDEMDSDDDNVLRAGAGREIPINIRGIEAALLADPGFRAWADRAINISPAAAGEYEAWAVPGRAGPREGEFESWVLRDISTMPVNDSDDEDEIEYEINYPGLNNEEPKPEEGQEGQEGQEAAAKEPAK